MLNGFLSVDRNAGSLVGSDLAMENLKAKISVTKLDAAKRQLRTAIRLWFQGGDPVSIHTLAFAAYEIIHVLSKKHDQWRRTLIFDSDWIKDEYRPEWNRAVKGSANFFKHAKIDSDASIDFYPSQTLLFLMASASGLAIMKQKQEKEELAFFYWLCFHQPNWIKPDFRKTLEDRLTVKGIREIKAVKKSDFLNAFDVALKPRLGIRIPGEQ